MGTVVSSLWLLPRLFLFNQSPSGRFFDRVDIPRISLYSAPISQVEGGTIMRKPVVLEDLDIGRVATDVDWVLRDVETIKDDEIDIERVRMGLILIELFEEAEAVTDSRIKSLQENCITRKIRTAFFVERVEVGQLGFEEWDAVVERAVITLIQTTVNISKDVKTTLLRYLIGVPLLLTEREEAQGFFRSIAACVLTPS